ncbi:dihydroneopterin aldolase [Halothiobacillus sp. DCM-1]|uniref:dihydroneopterin aldolase n=1 Tax=Halothiobacillus sp. DCM-1 TaxID=3112558 RepID=UPI00324B65D8
MSTEGMSAEALGGAWDWILIEGLEFDAILGIYPHERAAAQPVQFDLKLAVARVDGSKADDIQTTVDYQRVCEAVMSMTQMGAFQLVETLAQAVTDGLFARFSLIEQIECRVLKPLALPYARGVGIAITRVRPQPAPTRV